MIVYGHLTSVAPGNYHSSNWECIYYHPYATFKFTSSKEAGVRFLKKPHKTKSNPSIFVDEAMLKAVMFQYFSEKVLLFHLKEKRRNI